ncbi:hypothetical protein GTR29_003909 [Salmonella enterica]|nr:hypothetical protein [Salmonella enterica]EDT8479447.1 hypothetical protein [Salmonella enterica subsp. diarizonae]EDY2604390.1 hypothetical protein [Salmonella enterica]EED8460252.1 hypothetical protein [Salmonella enterica subsp. diarizonae serovar 61:i:z53]EED8579797.1 hypothetical protein [Salmonella enterica subsp. diarizonae serovar 61:i:z53]
MSLFSSVSVVGVNISKTGNYTILITASIVRILIKFSTTVKYDLHHSSFQIIKTRL